MFDFSQNLEAVWPIKLCPIGHDTWRKEKFNVWWERNYSQLSHLPAKLCEQWVFRHWYNSPFSFVPLDTLSCDLVELNVEDIIESIHRETGGSLNPEFDRSVFEKPRTGGTTPTAEAFKNNGTWDYPIIVLTTPNGLKGSKTLYPDARKLLVEGHQRHRYLNTLHYFEDAPHGPHSVFLLSSPVTDL
jgi:hypothetical protein